MVDCVYAQMEFTLMLAEDTFGGVDDDVVFAQALENPVQVARVLLNGRRRQNDVFDVGTTEIHVPYHPIHEPLDFLSRVSKPQRHVQKLEQSKQQFGDALSPGPPLSVVQPGMWCQKSCMCQTR